MSVWSLTYEGYDPANEPLREALCTLGNGYFATRGAAPESSADDVHYPGTYLTGCYNRLVTEVAGRPVENEDLVNLPNWLPLSFRISDGPWFDLASVEVLDYRQELNLHRGVLTRQISFRDAAGRETGLTQRRLVSMADPHLAALETTLVAENWSGPVEIRSALDGRVINSGVARYRALANQHLTPLSTGTVGTDAISLQVETNQSHIRIAQAARTRVFRDGGEVPTERRLVQEPGYAAHELSVELDEGSSLTIEKVITLYSSRDPAISESLLEAERAIRYAPGFDELLDLQVLSWAQMWQRGDLEIVDRDDTVPMLLHLHVFHLLQTVSNHSIAYDSGVPARGLHGEAYRGHIFWDELFILPYLNLRFPALSRALLRYRFRRLSEARRAAIENGYAGALYPWQSGSDGREESQALHLNPVSGRWLPDNSRLQRHISLAIAYNAWHYYEATGDVEFMSMWGAEMLLEIARFFVSITSYNHGLDRYEILGVMGPDEYHDAYPDSERDGLDNNAYTNVMVSWVLTRALQVLDVLPLDRRRELRERLALHREELETWDDVSRKMYVVFHGDGIISQFEGYEKLEELDWAGLTAKYGNIRRLDRILEAEGDTPNRYKASKQADVLMLFYLFSEPELAEMFERLGYPFPDDLISKNIDYYLARTSHGSTLSNVVNSWVLARSNRAQSWQFFVEALVSDVNDVQRGTTPEGIHLGAMAGTVDLVQRCYAGLDTRGDVLWFDPHLPEELQRLEFDVRYRGHWGAHVIITHESIQISTQPSAAVPIMIGVRDETFELVPGALQEVPL